MLWGGYPSNIAIHRNPAFLMIPTAGSQEIRCPHAGCPANGNALPRLYHPHERAYSRTNPCGDLRSAASVPISTFRSRSLWPLSSLGPKRPQLSFSRTTLHLGYVCRTHSLQYSESHNQKILVVQPIQSAFLRQNIQVIMFYLCVLSQCTY